jgi:hypothetical protein
MIIGEIEKVSNTNILVAKIKSKSNLKNYQLTVYSNKVNTQTPVAMVLPFPNKNMIPLVIETNKNDNNVYESINSSCFKEILKNFSLNNSGSYGGDIRSQVLEVFRSGSYRYSIANGIDDIKRIDQGVFNVKNDLQELLKSYSNKNFGFLICIIDKNVDYTPFAYITDIVDNEFFIPTKHYHEHNNTRKGTSSVFHRNIYGISDGFSSKNNDSNSTNDWDHSIYVIGAKIYGCVFNRDDFFPAHSDLNIKSLSHNYSFSKYLNDVVSCKKESLLKIIKKGSFENIDFIIPALD